MFWVVRARFREEIKNVVLDTVGLSCLSDICEELSSRQLYKWDWSLVEKSGLEMRTSESSISMCQ